MDYSKKIKKLREKALLVQGGLRDKLGIYLASINRWKNEFLPMMKIRRKLQKLFIEANIVEE